MPSKKYMNLDEYDSRVALYSDDAFYNGVTFTAKYIGSCEIPRPNSRLEIVAAMRRLRYEHKSKSMKKKKILLNISVNGVRVMNKETSKDPFRVVFLENPIHRIFYVSHDSLDKKIFSYIARGSNSFRCCVFKTNKKDEAMKIVRTIGQVFEVCHKLSVTYTNQQTEPTHSSTSKSKCVEADTPTKTGSLVQIEDDKPIDTPSNCIESTRRASLVSTSNSNESGSIEKKSKENKSSETKKKSTRSTGCQVGSSCLATPLIRECEVNRQVSLILQRLEGQLSELTNRIGMMEENQAKIMSSVLRTEQLTKERWASVNKEVDRIEHQKSISIDPPSSAPGLSSSVGKQRDLFSPPSLGFDSPEKSLSIFSSGISSQTPSPPSTNAMNIIRPTFSLSKQLNGSNSSIFYGLFD